MLKHHGAKKYAENGINRKESKNVPTFFQCVIQKRQTGDCFVMQKLKNWKIKNKHICVALHIPPESEFLLFLLLFLILICKFVQNSKNIFELQESLKILGKKNNKMLLTAGAYNENAYVNLFFVQLLYNLSLSLFLFCCCRLELVDFSTVTNYINASLAYSVNARSTKYE
jgi:hypothetical protein